MTDIIKNLRTELNKNIDEKTLLTSQNFFKEKIMFYGVKVPVVNRISRDFYKLIENESKNIILNYCNKLFESGYIEESFVASNWSYAIHNDYEKKDFDLFSKWIMKFINNWATCDTFCNHTMGEFIEMYPEYIGKLKEFTKSENRWMRRASAVSLIIPARKGKFINDIFEIADLLISDKDDLVQRGYGWMLKAASEAHREEVFEYVIKNKSVMPRTSLRYAIEKMPPDMKKTAMIRKNK